MGYIFMFLAGFLAGIGYEWFLRRSIWDSVGTGCFHGTLIAFGILMAGATFAVVVALRLNYWSHVAVLYGSFYGIILILWILELCEELWKKRRGGDSS